MCKRKEQQIAKDIEYEWGDKNKFKKDCVKYLPPQKFKK